MAAKANEANVALPDKRARARKPIQKNVASSKPKPEEIIEISPDSNEVAEKEKLINKEKAGEKSSKKKAPTLTSTLTARSKVNILSLGDFKRTISVSFEFFKLRLRIMFDCRLLVGRVTNRRKR